MGMTLSGSSVLPGWKNTWHSYISIKTAFRFSADVMLSSLRRPLQLPVARTVSVSIIIAQHLVFAARTAAKDINVSLHLGKQQKAELLVKVSLKATSGINLFELCLCTHPDIYSLAVKHES